MKKTRIAYCIDTFDIGGTELNAVRTAENLDSSRFELRVFHLQAGGPLYSRYQKLGVEMTHLPISGFRSPWTIIQGLRFAKHLRDWDAHIVHTHDVYTNIFNVPYARFFSRCRILSSRRWWDSVPRAGLPTMNRMSYRLSHRVLANSASVAAMLTRDEGVPRLKVVEIPNFLDESALNEVPEPVIREQRRKWGIPEGSFVIGIVARLAAVKNQGQLIEALVDLPIDCHVVLVGDGPSKQSLQQRAEALGVGERVHFPGEILSPINNHAMFDVSVLCSLSEGFPNSVIEAMGAGRPVVATPVGGVVDVITDNVTGLLSPIGDAPALARAIGRLRDDRQMRERLGSAGKRMVELRYHRDSVISKLNDLYATLRQSI